MIEAQGNGVVTMATVRRGDARERVMMNVGDEKVMSAFIQVREPESTHQIGEEEQIR